ncbi:MAG: sulfite exporter TauE/SafE family protein [Thermosynechococcaceae cyanobacterium]
MEPLSLGLFAGLGISAGVMAGMLGIGGGMLIVPGLFYLFSIIHLPEASLMHMAAGTSMCIMICTSVSSTWAHHSKGHIHWSIFRNIVVWLGLGVVVGNLLANRLPNDLLELIFGLFLFAIAIKIFLGLKPKEGQDDVDKAPHPVMTGSVGMAIGFKSGVLGIGGGALSVPFLLYCGLPMNQASGTSASFTLPIAITGTLSFLFWSHNPEIIPWSTGYVYWPAVAMVAPLTMIGAPIGAQLSRIVPAVQLKVIFACLLLFISLRMLVGTSYFNALSSVAVSFGRV